MPRADIDSAAAGDEVEPEPAHPVWVDLAAGPAAMLVQALGLSASHHRDPTFTRVRGLVAHLVDGAR